MATVSKQLTINVIISNVWTQMREGSGGTAYALPTSGSPQGDIKMIRLLNLSSGSSLVEVAISSGSVISDAQRIIGPITLAGNRLLTDDSVHVLRNTEGLWVRANPTSGSLNVTGRASLLEMT